MGRQELPNLLQSLLPGCLGGGDAVAAGGDHVQKCLRGKVIRPLDLMTFLPGEWSGQGAHVCRVRRVLVTDDVSQIGHPSQAFVAYIPHQAQPSAWT
ncbi:Uncharacterised protein [Mycobacteroides abscessus subsp. abscessus]|nr:Uncharacterised protein [Mycobacteroides abscessus subsp. abscessus]